jgi:hypothetical protein
LPSQGHPATCDLLGGTEWKDHRKWHKIPGKERNFSLGNFKKIKYNIDGKNYAALSKIGFEKQIVIEKLVLQLPHLSSFIFSKIFLLTEALLDCALLQILEKGSMVIKQLAWTDMGEYKCNAENLAGDDVASTFVYPMQVPFCLYNIRD